MDSQLHFLRLLFAQVVEQKEGDVVIIHICDRCAAKHQQQKGEQASTPNDWAQIQAARYGGCPYFELCPECIKKLGLSKNYNERQPQIADQLLEILEEIAQTQVEECGGCP